MGKGRSITVSAPGKVHLLGEHSVVYGKPAILAALDLRVRVTVSQGRSVPPQLQRLRRIIEKIIKKELKLKKFPLYSLEIKSDIPQGCGLGFSAAVSAAYLGALLSYLRVDWDLEFINKLTFEAEKVFHGNPSGGDNSAVVYGGLIWFRKEDPALKLIQTIPLKIPPKLAKNFLFINTGGPQESTRQMVEMVGFKVKSQQSKFKRIFDEQENLAKQFLSTIKTGDEKGLLGILRLTEKNLETMGVVSKLSQEIIRQIEKAGGAAKISGAGGKMGPTGILLCYHKNKKVPEKIAKLHSLPYFSVKLGTEGLRKEA